MQNQKGFGMVGIVVVVLVVAVIAATGYFVMNRSKGSSDNLSTNNSTTSQIDEFDSDADDTETSQTATSNTKTDSTNKSSLINGKVSFDLGDKFKTATGGYYSKDSGKCGQSVMSDVKCLDYVMLVPKQETFSNADQFHVDISVFEKTNEKSAKDWLEQDVDGGNENGSTIQNLQINGKAAIKYSVDYGNKERRVSYAIVGNGYGVMVKAIAFKGDYYSFKNTNSVDYFTYLAAVDTIANSVSF